MQVRAWADASVEDTVASAVVAPADGKYRLVVPVGFPDQGTYDFLDEEFYPAEAKTKFFEVSDRALNEWCALSGVRDKGTKNDRQALACRDRPYLHYGIRAIDDGTLRDAVRELAHVRKRHVVLMHVRENLLAAERRKHVAQFGQDLREAVVAVGPPSAAFKEVMVKRAKKEKANKKRLAVQAEIRQKKAERERKAADRKRAAEKVAAAKKAQREEAKKKAEAEGVEVDEEALDDEDKGEVEDGDDDDDEELVEEEVLSDAMSEDETMVFPSHKHPDIAAETLEKAFTLFSLPQEDEGFQAIKYMWLPREDGEKWLAERVVRKKQTVLIPSFAPSAEVRAAIATFAEQKTQWRKKQEEWNTKLAAMEKKEKLEDEKRKAAAEKPAEETKAEPKAEPEEPEKPAEEGDATKADGDAKEDDAEEKKQEGEVSLDAEDEDDAMKNEDAKEETKEEPKEEEPKMSAEEAVGMVDGMEPETVADINDVNGIGCPLFHKFDHQDWILVTVRYELHKLLHAFAHDKKDDDVIGMHTSLVSQYFEKYFKKAFVPTQYAHDTVEALLEYLKDTVEVVDEIVRPVLAEDASVASFVQLTEQERRSLTPAPTKWNTYHISKLKAGNVYF
jgi:hypothetical protein